MNKEIKSIMYIGIVLFLSLSVCSTTASALQVDQSNIENITEQLTQYRRLVGMEDDKAAIYIKEKMEEYGLNAHFEEFSFETETYSSSVLGGIEPLNLTTRNVIGIKEGASNQIIIIGAHYDTACPDCPGADDNAAGVATMLEIARTFQNESFNRTIYFIAFSAEEFGLVGSKSWLDNHEDHNDTIVAMINLDCVAYGANLTMTYIPQCDWLKDVFISKSNLNKRVGPVAMLGFDHHRFWHAGLPAVGFTDDAGFTLPGLEIRDTPNDTIATLNYSLAKECAEIVSIGVYNLASTDDLTPSELSVSVENGTIYYNVSDASNIQVVVDGIDLGPTESGKISLPAGEHRVKVMVTDGLGNRISDELIVDINHTYYTVPSFEGESVITLPWKKPEDDKPRWGDLFGSHFFDYEIENATGNVTVTGFIDGIKIDCLEYNKYYMVFTPGSHTFKVVAFNENGIIGFDEDTFMNCEPYSKPNFYPSPKPEPNFVMPLTIAVVLVIAIISFLVVKKMKTIRR